MEQRKTSDVLRTSPSLTKTSLVRERLAVKSDTLPLTWGFVTWGGLDSNQRPTDYESAALTN